MKANINYSEKGGKIILSVILISLWGSTSDCFLEIRFGGTAILLLATAVLTTASLTIPSVIQPGKRKFA